MGVGTSTGLNASSTAYAVNTDVNNRQLHPDEFDVIQIIAEKLGVNEEELKKAILYHVDKGWQDNIAEKEAEKIATYQDLYRQALVELNGRSINGYYLDDLYNMQDVDLEPSNVTGRQSSENETYDAPHVTLEPLNVVADRDFEADKTNLYLKQEGMAFNATNDDFNNGRIFAAKSFNEIQYNFPSLVKDMSVFEKLQETSDGFVAFSKGIAEGGVSSIKDLADAIMNLPNVDTSAIRERAYKLSSDTIKYLTSSQYRDSVNQEAVYDLKTDIAYGQILALQGDADKIGQVVGEATGKLATDLAISATTVGVGKVAGQTVKIVGGKSNDGNPNLPDVYGDGDLPNVYDRQRQWIDADKPYTEKSIFNQYPEQTKIVILDIDKQADFLSQAVNGLPKEQAKIILETAKSSNTSVVFGGSRVRGDFHNDSDVDVGFGHINATKAGKVIKKINDKSKNIDGVLDLESTRIVPSNETLSITKIESPEEFFQRSGIRADKDEKAGQSYVPSGSITINTDGTIIIIPPKKLK